MQLDDGGDNTFELWDFDGDNDQRWSLEHVRDGYYKIVLVSTGKVATSPDDLGNGVWQDTYDGRDVQLWRITAADSNGQRKLSPKKYPSYYMSAKNSGLTNGRAVQLRDNQSDAKDEWVLDKIKDKAIIIIPGITCSSLKNQIGLKVWLLVGLQDQVACDENGLSINEIYPYNPDNYGILDMYKNVYNTLSNELDDEYDIIFFAYDWRMSCANAAAKLESIVANYDSCIFVAHSMGGIVASSYLSRSQANRNKVDKFISIGTPYTGAPKALYVIETGRLAWITEAALHLSEYAKNIPAIYELLPTQKYFDRHNTFIKVNGIDKIGYDASWNYMKTLNWAKKESGMVKPMFSRASSFHDSLFINGTHVAERADVDTYKIIGVGEDTIYTVAFDANDKYDFYYYDSEGDGTVPTYSALNNVDKYSYKTYAFNKDHIDLIKYEGCIQLIMDIVNEVPYIYYEANSDMARASTIPYNNEVIISDDVQTMDNRITIVTKNILKLNIYTKGGSIVYSEGDKLFYNDIYGAKHRVGSVWSLGENSKQYVLFNGQYRINNINTSSQNSSIRLDYCNYGLSENCVKFENINTNTKIQIKKWMSGMSSKDGINIECTE